MAIATAASCANPGQTTELRSDPTADLPKWQGWRHVTEAPVLKAGTEWERGLWNDPSVLREGDGYVMYATTSTREMFKPPVLPFRLVSRDGSTWRVDPRRPLLDAASAGFASCETPSVVRFRGRYHMFFTGTQGEIAEGKPLPAMSIGHAISDDGVQWRPDPPGPVLRPTGQAADWNGITIGEPGAVVVGERMFVYFAAVGARPGGHPPQRHVIGLATTEDGRTFEAPREVLAQDARVYPPSRGYAGYSTPAAVLAGKTVYLFYDVVLGEPRWTQVALHFAASTDGLTFEQAPAPILTRRALRWTASEVRSPSVLIDGDTVHVWFAGHGDVGALIAALKNGHESPEFGIGYAETDLSALQRALATGSSPASNATGSVR